VANTGPTGAFLWDMRTLDQDDFSHEPAPTVAFVGVSKNMRKDREKHAFSAGCVSNRRASCVTRERNGDRKRHNHPTQTEKHR
jgi:hypothetical protein